MDKSISRRRFITAAGVTITLPMLPSLMYSKRAGAADCPPARRFLTYYFPNGHHMPEHVPAAAGAGSAWSLPAMLAPMQELKSDLLFVSGLENQQRRRENGDHAIGCGALLTARKPQVGYPFMSTSVDQIIADAIGTCVRLPSLQLGTQEDGPPDYFGTMYTRNISWRAMTQTNADGSLSFPAALATPLGKEIDPKKAFDRLFVGTNPSASAAEAAMRLALRKSVLDAVVPHGDWLKNRLNPADGHKVDELFTGIRSLEQQLQAGTGGGAGCTSPEVPAIMNLQEEYLKQLDAMHTLMALAFQCDITRVITFMMGDAVNSRLMTFIPEVAALGGDASDHPVSHHMGRQDMVAKFRAMVLWKMQQIAGFLNKLKGTTDSDGQSLLKNMLVFIGSEISDGNRHNHDDKPILVAGQLGGSVVTDRHVRYPTSSDYTQVKTHGDFFITLLSLFGVRANEFGNDGKEALAWNK